MSSDVSEPEFSPEPSRIPPPPAPDPAMPENRDLTPLERETLTRWANELHGKPMALTSVPAIQVVSLGLALACLHFVARLAGASHLYYLMLGIVVGDVARRLIQDRRMAAFWPRLDSLLNWDRITALLSPPPEHAD
jgi:hypothetical protein